MPLNRDNEKAAVDWEEVRRRIEQMNEALKDQAIDPERQQQILRDRAARMARPLVPADMPDGPLVQVLEFTLAGERYGIEACHVGQVYPAMPITPIPGVPNYILGIVAPEGEVLAIVDLRSLLKLPLAGLFDPCSIIVLRDSRIEFGILAEQIMGIETYAEEALLNDLPAIRNGSRSYLKGVSPSRAGILNAAQLMADPRLVVDMR